MAIKETIAYREFKGLFEAVLSHAFSGIGTGLLEMA
jgi:hypothetical protein